MLRRMVMLVLVVHLLVGQIVLGTVDDVPVGRSEAATAASSAVHVAATAVHFAIVMVHGRTLVGVPAEHAAAAIGGITEASGEFVSRKVHLFLGFAVPVAAGTLVGSLPASSGSSVVVSVTSGVVVVIPLLALILVLPVGTRIFVVDPAVLLLPACRRIIPALGRSLVRFLIVRSVAVLRRAVVFAAIPRSMFFRRTSTIEGSRRRCRFPIAPVPLDMITSRRGIIRIVVSAEITVAISTITIVTSAIFAVVVATFTDWRRWRWRRVPLVRTVSSAGSAHDCLLLVRGIFTIA